MFTDMANFDRHEIFAYAQNDFLEGVQTCSLDDDMEVIEKISGGQTYLQL